MAAKALVPNLPSFGIHVIIVLVYHLGERDKSITHFFETGNHGIQRLGGIFSAVVAEDDRAVSKSLVVAYPFNNVIDAVIFPVKGVITCNR